MQIYSDYNFSFITLCSPVVFPLISQSTAHAQGRGIGSEHDDGADRKEAAELAQPLSSPIAKLTSVPLQLNYDTGSAGMTKTLWSTKSSLSFQSDLARSGT